MSKIIKATKVEVGSAVAIDVAPLLKKVKENQARVLLDKQRVTRNQEYSGSQQFGGQDLSQKCFEEAKIKAEFLYEEEVEKARKEGIEQASREAEMLVTQAREDAKVILEEVVALKKNAMEDYSNMCKVAQQDIIELVWDIVERVVNKEIEKDSEYIIGLIEGAMEKVIDKKNVILKVSDIDYANVAGNTGLITARVEGFGDVEVIKESSLRQGSCIVETKYGIIDGGIKTRLSQIQKEVEKILKG